jgi:hypothetical protein
MKSLRPLAVGLVGLSLALGGSAAALLTQAEAGGASTAHAQTRLQPNGVDFGLHTELDPNFCLEDIPAPENPASEASVSQCAVRDGQHWTFANAADGSVVIIGGNTGNCLDFSGKVGSFVSMTPCTFGASEHFSFNKKGQIESASGRKCLQASQATQDAQVVFATCQKGVALQIWTLSH